LSDDQPLPRLGWVLLGAITVFWGTNWVALKIALSEIPVWQYRALTCGVGGLALLGLALAGGHSVRVPRKAWRPLALGALFNVTGWTVLSGFGVRLLGSGEASVASYTMPVWATLLGVFVLGERLTARILAALGLSVVGIMALLSNSLEALGAAPLGVFLMLSASVSWATGTIVLKRVAWPMPVIAVVGWQLLIGACPILLVAVMSEPYRLDQASATALWALVYTLLLPLTFCYYAWYKVVSLFPASIASIGTVLIPVVAVLSGALVLGEPVGWREITALLAVASAIGLVLFEPSRKALPERS
jgi:drug/metabolite transporter (DMT)-like permease